MPETTFTARLRRFDLHLSSAVRSICVALLGAIVLTISASVFSRFIIFNPLNFADALAKYLMQWMVFLGVGLAIRSGEHVLVDIVAVKLSRRSARVLLVLNNALVSVLLAVVAYYGTLNALSATGSRDPFVFGISMAIPYASVAVGAAYALVQSNITTWLNLHDPDFSLQTPSTRLPE
ncbi:TRAP transporter small permease [Frigidibacter oleivorans]|uniref:TRAP transporter small permease n=1 Tax=Frigidibacter oleivorans TaxID=2487129 RepID=UPI000F8DA223|nr:TRAP transporter small permease [Frigidibacter oleivorans]